MTNFYRFLRLTIPALSKSYFGDIKTVNVENVPVGEPILFVANHPSALMDPLVCGAFTPVPIHFLGRADLFKSKFNSWFLRNAHMWPIYRDVDGKDSLEKNEQVFKECYKSLKGGNPVLLYGEGVTDETFIRRVKRIKKGAARIGFGAEEAYNWEMGLNIVPIGMNYTNPAKSDSDLMLRYAKPIKLIDYKEQFDENPVKAMLAVTREIEDRLLAEVVHIKKKNESEQLEKALMLFEDSMHYTTEDTGYPLEKRWEKSKSIAEKLNYWDEDKKERFFNSLEAFWSKVKDKQGSLHLIQALNGTNTWKLDVLELIMMFPIALLGFLLNIFVFPLLSILPEKLAKRTCFHSGMRVAFSLILIPLFSFVNYGVITSFIEPNVPGLYFFVLFGGILLGNYALRYRRIYRRIKKNSIGKKELSQLKDLNEFKSIFNQLKSELV